MNYALALLPLSHGTLYFLIFRIGTYFSKNTGGGAPLWQKLEVAEQCSVALHLTLTTAAEGTFV